MNEDLVKSLNLELRELNIKRMGPEMKLKAAEDLRDKTEMLLPKNSSERDRIMTVLYEIMGNQKLAMKEKAEAEKCYRSMLETALRLYKKDKEKCDLLYAQANLRMAIFYKDLLGIQVIPPKPRKLNDSQKKIFDVTEKLFRTAMQICLDRIRKGQKPAVELEAACIGHLMVMKGSIGDYDTAEKYGEQVVNIEKALFQATDDAPHALELAQWMALLTSVYMIRKKFVKAMELTEDCIYVLEDKQDEAPEAFDIRLASSWINLGNACGLIPEEKGQAGKHFDKGLAMMRQLNQDYDGKYRREEKQAWMVAASFYHREGNTEKAEDYRKNAVALDEK